MYKRVIAYPDGRVVFHYTDNKKITYNKDKAPEISFNTKEKHGHLDRISNVSIRSDSHIWH